MNTGDPNFGKQYIQFTCRAVSRQVGPLYPNGSAIYRYDGCWKENNPGRQLKVQLWGQNSNNTNDACISACATQSYTYAGTQYVNECWCGNKIPKLLVNNTECNYACSGDDTETCGGNGVRHKILQCQNATMLIFFCSISTTPPISVYSQPRLDRVVLSRQAALPWSHQLVVTTIQDATQKAVVDELWEPRTLLRIR